MSHPHRGLKPPRWLFYCSTRPTTDGANQIADCKAPAQALPRVLDGHVIDGTDRRLKTSAQALPRVLAAIDAGATTNIADLKPLRRLFDSWPVGHSESAALIADQKPLRRLFDVEFQLTGEPALST